LQIKLPPLLAALEAEGTLLEEFMLPEHLRGHEHPLVRQIVQLGINYVNSWPPSVDEPNHIHVTPDGMDVPIDVPSHDCTEALDKLLVPGRWPDVERKLATPSDEAHLFIGISPSSSWALNWALYHHQTGLPPDKTPPGLPGQATHLWLMSASIGQR